MTYSLDIHSGDLAVGGLSGGLAVVTGGNKLIQDLKCAVLTRLGTLPMHPNYGSGLDGGVLPDGTLIETHIGNVITRQAMLDVEQELRRILTDHQRQQLTRLKAEQAFYSGQDTFDPGEILYAVDGVQVQQFGDTLVARISIRTASGRALSFAQPVGRV
jgi:hypothetical protein